MYRNNKKAHTGEAIADMSQFSVEEGRLDIQTRYEKLMVERQILVERKLILERSICDLKVNKPQGLRNAGEHKERRAIIDEIQKIQARLVKIKPMGKKLHDMMPPKERTNSVILEEILVVLKRLETNFNEQE